MKIFVLVNLLLVLLFIPVNAQTKIAPIIEIYSHSLLGGIENGKWIDAKTTAGKLGAEDGYKIYDLNSSSNRQVKFPKPLDEGVPCEGYYSVEHQMDNSFGVAIGDSATWNAVPRASRMIDLNDATYKKAVADMLRTKRLPNSRVNITKAIRVDLEGDGQEEVLIEATSYKDSPQPRAQKGDYSLILLRKIVGGKVQNILVSGDFVTKNIEFGAPSKFHLSSIADLNGDGKMEIIIYGAYYEGSWVETHQMIGNRAVKVKAFDVGCGV